MAYIFGSIWDRFNRNALNDLSKSVELQGKSIQDLVAEGQLTPAQYTELITAVNGMVKSGQIDISDLSLNFKTELDEFSSQLAEKASREDIRHKNVLIGESDITPALQSQIAGTAPIANSIPANESVSINSLSPSLKQTYALLEESFNSRSAGVNMYDKNLAVDNKYMNRLGEELSASTFMHTGYVPVYPNGEFTVSVEGQTIRAVILYNKSLDMLQRVTANDLSECTFSTHDNTFFIVASINMPSEHSEEFFRETADSIQVERGDRATAYVPHEPFYALNIDHVEDYSISKQKLTQEVRDGLGVKDGTITLEKMSERLEGLIQSLDHPTISNGNFYNRIVQNEDIGFLENYINLDGSVYPNTPGWFRFSMDFGRLETGKFMVVNPLSKQIRITYFYEDGTSTRDSAGVTNRWYDNKVRELAQGSKIMRVVAYFSTPNSTPAVAGTEFPDTSGFKLSIETYEGVKDSIGGHLDYLMNRTSSTTGTKQLKILALGNSYSQNLTAWVDEIFKSLGADVILGTASIGSQSFNNHILNIETDRGYGYVKQTLTSSVSENMPISQIIIDEEWDFVIIQQVSSSGGVYSTFQPYLHDFIEWLRLKSSNPHMQVGLQMTWAYATDYVENYAAYDGDQITMYHAITEAYQQAMHDEDIDLVIPSGTAIQNARTNIHLMSDENELTRDGTHLSDDLGRFIAGLTLFQSVLSEHYGKNIEEIAYRPPNVSAFHAMLSKHAVRQSILNPFRITEI